MAWCCLPPLNSPCHRRGCKSTHVTEDDSSVPTGTPVPGRGGPAVIAGGLVPPAVARGVSSTVPSASPGIGPPAPLAGGPLGAIIGATPSRGRGWLNGFIHRSIPRHGQIKDRRLFERINRGGHHGASELPPMHFKEEGFGIHLVEREDNSAASFQGKGEIGRKYDNSQWWH